MTILVTGANGFIGSHVVRSLLKRDYQVRVFVRPDANMRNLDGLNVEVVHGDLLRAGTVVDAAAGCKAVIHTAGLVNTHPFNGWRNWEINFLGAANVFTAAQLAGVDKVIYTASIFTLGVGADGQPVNETVADNLGHLKFSYIAARRAAQGKAEKMLAAGLPIVFVYPTYCIGPNVHDWRASPQRQIMAFVRGQMPFCPSGGMNLVDVRDAAEAHVLALERGEVGSKYLAGGQDVTFRDLFTRLSKVTKRRMLMLPVPRLAMLLGGWLMQWFSRSPLMDYSTAALTRYCWYYDSSLARHDLGYSPRPLDETLCDLVAWLRENRYIRA
jgi:dihydroflavonol-4-reductase